jgi:serine/threonine protein kinase
LPTPSAPHTRLGSSTGTLKPANLIVTAQGSVKVVDFGVAKIAESSSADGETRAAGRTDLGAVIGTAEWPLSRR